MTTKPRHAACLSLLLLSLPAAAQFEGTADVQVTAREEGHRMEGKGRLYVTPSAWRMEMEMTVAEAEKGSPAASAVGGMVGHRMVAFGKASEPRKAWMVNDRTKTYAIVEDDPDEPEETPGATDWKITRLGADRVAGLACASVKAERAGDDVTREACFAKEMATARFLEGKKESDDEGWMRAAERAGVIGYPVRMIARGKDGKERERFEVTRVERKKLAASLFEVPKGYRQTSLLESLAQTPEEQAKMGEAKRQLEEAMKSMPPEQRKAMEEMMKRGGATK
jgi:hypothetical protein